MTIYITPFDVVTLQWTGPSTDSGFESLEQVREMMGEPIGGSRGMLIYGDDVNRIAYSRARVN